MTPAKLHQDIGTFDPDGREITLFVIQGEEVIEVDLSMKDIHRLTDLLWRAANRRATTAGIR